MPPSHYFMYNSVKNEQILKIFGTQNPEDISHWFLYTCLPHLKNVIAPHSKMQNFFAWLTLYDFPANLNNCEKQLAIMLSRNLFQRTSVKEVDKSYYCLHWCTFLSLLIQVYHSAVLAFSPCCNEDLMWLAQMLCTLCCFTAFGAYNRSFCEFLGKPQ